MSVASTCTFCAGVLPEGARFCPSCGNPVAGEAGVEERRIVTVLFADLVGFTSLAGEVVIRVDDFADDETLAMMEMEDPFELTGLYHGVDIGLRDGMGPAPEASRMRPSPSTAAALVTPRPALARLRACLPCLPAWAPWTWA